MNVSLPYQITKLKFKLPVAYERGVPRCNIDNREKSKPKREQRRKKEIEKK